MPKRVGHLYEKMCDKDLIREAIRKGSKHKKKRWDVKLVMKKPEKYVEKNLRPGDPWPLCSHASKD